MSEIELATLELATLALEQEMQVREKLEVDIEYYRDLTERLTYELTKWVDRAEILASAVIDTFEVPHRKVADTLHQARIQVALDIAYEALSPEETGDVKHE